MPVNKKGAPIFTARKNLFAEESIESRHQGGISDTLFEHEINVTHADFAAPPGFFQDLPLEFAERERSNFARPAKSAQKKSRSFHLRRIVG